MAVTSSYYARLNNADDLERLTETKMDQQGRSKKCFLPSGENIQFAFRAFAKVHGFACSADYSVKGWTALLDAAKIRDRLMHPKSSHDLEVSFTDLDGVREASGWFFPTRDRLVAQATREVKKHG